MQLLEVPKSTVIIVAAICVLPDNQPAVKYVKTGLNFLNILNGSVIVQCSVIG